MVKMTSNKILPVPFDARFRPLLSVGVLKQETLDRIDDERSPARWRPFMEEQPHRVTFRPYMFVVHSGPPRNKPRVSLDMNRLPGCQFDTDGDGNCPKRLCPACHPEQWSKWPSESPSHERAVSGHSREPDV